MESGALINFFVENCWICVIQANTHTHTKKIFILPSETGHFGDPSIKSL